MSRSSKRRKTDSSSDSSTLLDLTHSDEDELPEEISNLTGETPYPGMRLEIRDSDSIWSPAYLTAVKERRGAYKVTVRCDGWGKKWDEQVDWPSPRLARLFSYTRLVRCLVIQMVPGKKKTIWPAKVQFRMPHPARRNCPPKELEDSLNAEVFLREEQNIHVIPYGRQYLPKSLQQTLNEEGGIWVHNKQLRAWTVYPSKIRSMGMEPPGFAKALDMARADDIGSLPTKVIEAGTLVREQYRVFGKSGFHGPNYRGQLVYAQSEEEQDKDDGKAGRQQQQQQQRPVETVASSHSTSSSDSDSRVSNAVATRQGTDHPATGTDFSSWEDVSTRRKRGQPDEHLPVLPTPTRITEPLFPGVRRCRDSNRWLASVVSGGNNPVFLGTFETQTQARQAIGVVTGEPNAKVETDTELAQLCDIDALSMEQIVEASEQRRKNPVTAGERPFSLHEWYLQRCRSIERAAEENASL